METFELDVVVRKKLVQLRGTATPRELPLAHFLHAHQKPKDTLLICLAESMQYQGCELEESLLFTLLILSAETYNLLYASTAIAYPISIMITAVYALLFISFANYKFQMLLQVFFLVMATAVLVISMSTDLVDKYIMMGITVSVAVVLVARLMVYIQDYILLESPSSGFTLESNLIVLLYACWKGYEAIISGSYSGLLAGMAALGLINTVKVYVLFNYNILHVISIFCEQANQSLQENNQTTPDLTQSIALFVQNKNDESEIELNREKDSIVESKVEGNEEQTVEASSIPLPHKQYESQKSVGVTIVMLLIFTGQMVYVGINMTAANASTILPQFFATAIQVFLLVVVCQCQKVVKGYEKEWLITGYIYVMDVLMVVLSAVVAYFQSSLGLPFSTAIFYSIFPLLVVKIFNDVNEQVHSQLDNGKYYLFFTITLMPFCLRSIALFHGITVATHLIDAAIYLYAVVILVFWSNRSNMLGVYQEIRSVLSVKKRKIKFFDKLKQLRVHYPNLVQNFVFIHVILLSTLYSLTVFTSLKDQFSYFIFYFAPLLLYLTCLLSNHTLTQTKPESYSPSLLTIALLLLSGAYAVLPQVGVLEGDHETFSLQVLMNVFLFSVLREGERMAVVYLQSYSCFVRVLLVSVFFVFIYLPFVSVFIAGYYWSGFSQDYFYYFMLGGFFYVWLLITLAGTAIHLVLNLTEKSKKDLFIAQYMENQMRKIGLKENIEKFLMISNEYELLNQKSEDLLRYLKEEKHMMVVVRREKEVPHDYELVEPDDNLAAQRIAIVAKPINPLDAAHRIAQNASLPQQQQEKENPVLTYLREKEKARIEVTRPADLNRNALELKRMAQRSQRMTIELREVERSQEFKSMKAASSQKCAELMARLYNFLSEPSECVSRETFGHLLRLLTRQQLSPQETDKVYVRFSESGLINEYRFKKFLVDYVEFKYEMRQGRLCDLLRTFCCYELAPLFQARFTALDYHLRRKQLQITPESREIWLRDGGSDQDDQQFRELRVREARKKEKLLNQPALQDSPHPHSQTPSEEQSSPSEGEAEEVEVEGVVKLRLTMRKQLKDKTFLRPQNIYAMLVNALMECYLFYEKEAEHFKIKSIKVSVSNVLALATKASDICLVFGYPTLYLLIAYFQEDYSSPIYPLSTISYPVLLSLAAASTLLYIALIVYHKRDFEMGSLGLDGQHRSLGICSLKFFTTQLLFLLGSALANYIMSIGLNSLICSKTQGVLFNFEGEVCYGERQFVYMFVALLILAVYWPLSAITFPFSTAMDRQLEIKYKSEFEIVYLQFKFLINGSNTLLNPYDFQTEQLIVSLLKVVLCLVLAVLYGKMQPCSYQLLNRIEGKVYVLLTILSFTGALCYFVGLLQSLLITGGLIVLYLAYFVYSTVKNLQKMREDNPQDDLVLDNIRNQQIKIKVIRDHADPANAKPILEDDHISEVKLTDFPTQDYKNTSPQASKQTFQFW